MSWKQALIAANTTRNVGTWDRAIRAALPVVIGGLWLAHVLPSVVAAPLGAISLMLFPTAITGACSIYYFLGFSTCPVSGRPRPVEPQGPTTASPRRTTPGAATSP